MDIVFLRLGFANNSSSQHSVIVVGGSAMDVTPSGGYDWGAFFLGSREAKLHYLASVLYAHLTLVFENKKYEFLNSPEAKNYKELADYARAQKLQDDEYLMISQRVSVPLPGIDELEYVDHQSVFSFPVRFPSGDYDHEFIDALFSAIADDASFAILGGNDNDYRSPEEHLYDLGVDTVSVADPDRSFTVQRKIIEIIHFLCGAGYNTLSSRRIGDRQAYVLSDSKYGHLSIVSFDSLPVNKLDVPYLVDIKITDNCPYKCPFCYQASEPAAGGAAVDPLEYERLALMLSEAGVMEVALGGGEPTTLNNLDCVVKAFRDFGIKVGLTTHNLDPEYWATWAAVPPESTPHSIAFSITNLGQLPAFFECAKIVAALRRGTSIGVQVVVGVLNKTEIMSLAEELAFVGYKVTFLGYKTAGRGGSFTPKMANSEFVDALGDLAKYSGWYGIDSVLAEDCRDQLKTFGVADRYLSTGEGQHTCYIDMPGKVMAPSSFCQPEARIPIGPEGLTKEQFISNFQTF